MTAQQTEGFTGHGSYRDRVARLSDKLVNLHEGLDHDRNVRYEHLQGRMMKLDERLSASQDTTNNKFNLLRNQLGIFQNELDTERLTRQAALHEKNEEIVKVDAALQSTLEAEQEARRETEVRILSTFDEKTNALKEDISKSGSLRMENEANLRRYLEVDIPKLYESLKEEVHNREAMEQRMLKKAMEEVTQLQGAILAEKKAREDTEEAMLRMMEDVVQKMQAEIANERKERERTEEMLLSLLNDTCRKLQMASQQM